MSQERGIIGKAVGGMIRRSVRRQFRNVYYRLDPYWENPSPGPYIFVANHHGWHDGYLLFHLVSKLKTPSLDWIQEFASFPLFAHVGGMPFPANDATTRATTIRRTVRSMREEKRSLVLFAEGILHRGPDLLPFGSSLDFIRRHVPEALPVPVAIVYDYGKHERQEAFLNVGRPSLSPREDLESLLNQTRSQLDEVWPILARGTPDVNERWYARRLSER